MRIAVFTNQFPSQLNTFFARSMRSLIETGINVDIFSIYPLNPDYWQNIPDFLNNYILPRSSIHHINIADCLPGIFSKSTWKNSGLITDFLSISASSNKFGFSPLKKSIYSIIKGVGWAYKNQEKYDHILAYWGNYAATSAYIFQRIYNRTIPFSLFLHAGTDLYRDQVFLKEKLLYADNIFVVCDFNYRFIQKLYPESFDVISPKIHLHHLGLDFSEFPYSTNNRLDNKVIGVGSLSKLKGFEYLIRAVNELIIQGIYIELDLVGDGEERPALESLVNSLNISDNVHFLGWQPFSKVKIIMQSATLLVHPSSDLGDAVPTVIKEAMALGTPVVASNVAGIPELLNNGKFGILVPPRDTHALAFAIQKILENKALQIQYSKSARQFAEDNFDLWKNGKILADILISTHR